MTLPRACFLAVLVLVVVVSPAFSAPPERPADLILTGATVVTLDPARPRATAIAVREGRIVLVGADAEVRALAGPATRRLELTGRTVVPGLTDAHVHVESLGASLEELSLDGVSSLQDSLERIRAAAAALPSGEWLLGRGWDQTRWPGQQFPTAAAMDAVTGGHPAYLERVDGHAGWANTKAITLAGLTASTTDPAGGRILRDAKGAPAGVFVDNAQALVSSKIPPPSRAARKRHLARGLEAAAQAGLTEVHDAGVPLDTIPLYKELLAEGKMPARAYVMLAALDPDNTRGDVLAANRTLRPEIGLGDGRLTVRAIKVVSDGALGSRGAYLLAPYTDEPGTRGLLRIDAARFHALLAEALARGFQVNTHAIGDAANRFVLDEYERAFAGVPGGGRDRRFRVEHAQVLAPADVPRFKSLGVIPSVQPTHCTSDMRWAEARVGPVRIMGAYLWKTFLDQGVVLAGGSDAPVESIAVLPGLYAAVTRQDARGWPPGGWHPQERVTIDQALRMFSEGAAYAAFEDKDLGRIAAGRRADLTVLGKDPTAIPATELLTTPVVMTVVGGGVEYDASKATTIEKPRLPETPSAPGRSGGQR